MIAIARACLAGEIDARVALVVADRADAAGLASARDLGRRDRHRAAHRGRRHRGLSRRSSPPTLDAASALMSSRSPASCASSPRLRRALSRAHAQHPPLAPARLPRPAHAPARAGGRRRASTARACTSSPRSWTAVPWCCSRACACGRRTREAALAARVLATEHIIYPRVLGWFAQRRLTWHDDAAWLDGARLDAPIVEDFRAAVR